MSVDSLKTELTNFDKNAQNPIDMYNQALSNLGISDARTRLTDLRQSLINNQNMVDQLPANIQARTANALVSEGQRQRLQAVEQAPLIDAGNKLNQQFGAAQGDYQNIMSEGKTQADLTYEGQRNQRAAIMDRLKIAIDQSKTAEEKRRWQAEFNRQKKQDALAKQQWEKEHALDRYTTYNPRNTNTPSPKSSSVNPKQDFLTYISQQFKAAGKNPSRQTQDAWANAWFSSKKVSKNARQAYWDLFNKTYKRPGDPTKDWLYKR